MAPAGRRLPSWYARTVVKLADLVLAASWPSRRDKMRYDTDWILWIVDLRRVIGGIPLGV